MDSSVFCGQSEAHGRGVFAARDIKEGEVLEACEVIVVPKEQVELIDKTILYDYYYSWDGGSAAIALGLGSLYNHSYSPNARYEKDFGKGQIKLRAIKDIREGDEVLVNYNGEPEDQTKVWFDF